ncbi:MAG: tRNA uridine-5-carboxymethylaminomethyl(34) synthesis GTPase MnmE, partial [Deltaproteobacteria bacterium]|nr:tRNA uridine-5-carboxymethylaminomethyl(34) synthesis GTPase MnmE [Deltaproteobacteria bacterium]
VFMAGPHSFTGEDVAEFHLHGSPLLARQLLRSLFSAGATPATPGEFTKRAFLNGKIDLIQAEAVCDLIEATSSKALALAGGRLQGELSRTATQIGEELREALAEIEAGLDFPEEDLGNLAVETKLNLFGQIEKRLDALVTTCAYGQNVREGFKVLLWGRPNVGKSSLLNMLLGQERAIVTEVSGTTRDLIEESLELEGFRFVFCDTAGVGESLDKVEKIAMERAKQRIPWADLVLYLVDADAGDHDWKEAFELLTPHAKKIWIVTNKIDLNPAAYGLNYEHASIARQGFFISAKHGDGLDELKQALIQEFSSNLIDQSHANQIVTNERHRDCLVRALAAVRRATQTVHQKLPEEITALELRSALNAMNELIGATTNEDILGRIFSRFCIGK